MTVTCRNCGETWPEDPALQVPCPSCAAEAGEKCRRPSDHRCRVHPARDRLAVEQGVLEQCSTASSTVSERSEQAGLTRWA